MKKIFNLKIVTILLFSILFWGCKKDSVEPTIDGLQIQDNDLVQVTNANRNVPITVTASDNKSINAIEISITKDDATAQVVATNAIRNLTANSLNRFTVNVPFPMPAVAPSGRYVANVTIIDNNNNKSTKSYKLSILNYQTAVVAPCTFPTLPLPAGKNVWVRLTVPANTVNDVYIVGNFMVANGGAGDWNPRDPAFKMEKVSDFCFRIAVNLANGNEFKFTSPTTTTNNPWDFVMKDGDGNDYSGPGFCCGGNMVYGQGPFTGAEINFTVGNWRDRVVPAPITLPAGAIQTGKITLVVDVNSNDDSQPYYFVKQGATSLTGAITALRVTGTNRVAAAVPKEAGVNYVVVRQNITKTGINAFGFDRLFNIDGVTNPVNGTIAGFKTEYTPTAVPTQLFVTGAGVPSSWTPNPPANQQFTGPVAGKFTLNSVALTANSQIKFLFQNTGWNPQLSVDVAATDRMSGTFRLADADPVPTPSTAGNYRIEVDFSTTTYKLTRL